MLSFAKYLVFLAWLLLALEADDALGEDDTDFQMLEVFGNHVEVMNAYFKISISLTTFIQAADNLLRLFELNQFNPIEKSLKDVQQTLVIHSLFNSS